MDTHPKAIKKYQCLGQPDPSYIYWLDLEFISGFLEINIILLKGISPFKMHKIIFFSRKKNN